MDDCKLTIVNSKIRQRIYLLGLLFLAGLIFCQGCSGSIEKSLWQQITDLTDQKSTLSVRVEKLQQENDQLHRQVLTLQHLDPNERMTAVDVLETIVIGSRTGLYDKNEDGKKESLVVYIEPTDSAGDRVKAPGEVEVQLWNLDAKDPHKALLEQWTVKPAELKECWSSMLMTDYYRLVFKAGDVLPSDPTGLTVKVRFIDYFSGKVFEDQRAIK